MNTRRSFLKLAGVSGLTTLVAMKGGEALADCDFRPTPKQFPLDTDVDLTRIAQSAKRARGELVIVEGIVTDDNCHPVEGAIVEIWQACHTGRYNHPSDTSENPLDPDFQYYGIVKTDKNGKYSFKTIKPGSYLASEDWRRPPHIHYKVSLRGFRELITQLYFAGDVLNQHDQILQQLNGEDQKKVVVAFEKKIENGEQVLKGKFDITLRRIF
jgi:protocatechuate 3,4-dioxygenase beta subunit